MGSSLFTSALSGMNAAQLGLATTQHNISNASTPGFTRQEVLTTPGPAQSFGGGFIGQGVNVTGVQRIYDQFLNTQILHEQAQATYLTTYHDALAQIDNLVADPAAGASPAMREFFSAMNGVANSPESIPARQTLLSNAQFAANRFQAIDQRLTDIADGLTGQVSSSVDLINSYAQQIAALNGNIKRYSSVGQGKQPNDLLDQRDQLINKLNQEVKTTTLRQSDGTMSVFIGTGQTLVVNEDAMSLRVVRSDTDPSKVDIAYQGGNTTVAMQQSSLQGGKLGAYLTFRDQSLETMRNELGRVALGMALSVNQQNQMGLDLRGEMGQRVFNVATPRVDAGAKNLGSAQVFAAIADVNALTTSDYQLKVNGVDSYTMVRMSDNSVTPLTGPMPHTVDGFTVSLASGAAQSGDTFLIRPTANAARDLSVVMSDPAKIAAADPMRATPALNVKGNLLSSTITLASPATVSGVTVNDPANANLMDPVSITFDAVAGTYTVVGAVPDVSATPIAYVPGEPINLSYNGWTAQISGTPAHNDVVDIAPAGAKVGGVTIDDPANAKLTAPVRITFSDATNYTVEDVSGAVPVALGAGTYNPLLGKDISFNGWTVQVTGAPVAGDVFNVGTNTGAATVSGGSVNMNPVSITFSDPLSPPQTYTVADVSGAAPVVLGTGTYTSGADISFNGWTTQVTGVPALGDVFSLIPHPNSTTTATMQPDADTSNTGGATIAGGVLDWTQPFSVIFDAQASTYTVTGAIPDVSATPISYTPGSPITILHNGWTAQITGTPATGDVFNFAPNTNAAGDNRNALTMAALQTENILADGTASLQSAYSQLVGRVGAKTNEMAVTSEAQNHMVAETVKAQQSISGVNLDEEAANLLRFQRAYEAAAKALQVSNTMFEAVLALGR